MRVLIFLALLAPILAFEINVKNENLLNQLQQKQGKIFEKEIIAFLECIRGILKEGDEEVGLPILDPFFLEFITFDLSSLGLQGVEGNLDLEQISMKGLAGWDLSQLKIDITLIPLGAKMLVNVGWPNGTLSGKYLSKLNIFDHAIIGEGLIDGALQELNVDIEGQIVLGEKISLENFKFAPSLADAHLLIDSLSIDGNDISQLIKEIAEGLPAFLNDETNQEIISQVVQGIVNMVLDALINNNKYADIPIIGKCLP